jgi:lipoprotein-releasing system permease protein
MNTELFIAKKLFLDKTNKNFLSYKIIRIALFGIALGLAVMLVSVAVVTGFKQEIREKVIGFGSHIQIINYNSNNSYETQSISKNQPFLPLLEQIDGIVHVEAFATKPGMIKTEEYIQGVVFKGVDRNYDWDFFSNNLAEGRLPLINDSVRVNEIIISQQVAQLLKIKLNDNAVIYFLNETELLPRILQLKVCGIYRTGLDDFDNIFIIGDIKYIQRLNNWDANEISGFEISISDFGKINEIEEQVNTQITSYRGNNEPTLQTVNIVRQYPQIFDWLSVIDMNVWVILILLSLVAGFNMISGLLVIILERSSMIGILKALGSQNISIRKIFLYQSWFITVRGMLWGNIFAVTIMLLQNYFHIVQLDSATYYINVVPINFSVLHFLLINAASMLITMFMLVIPSYLVSKITPEKSIRFD